MSDNVIYGAFGKGNEFDLDMRCESEVLYCDMLCSLIRLKLIIGENEYIQHILAQNEQAIAP